MVARHRHVRLERLDRHGASAVDELSGWPARIVQHETDHLNGVLYVDRAETRSLATTLNHARWWAAPTPAEAAQRLGFELPG